MHTSLPPPLPPSSSRGCFLCGFSFFVHAHLYVCASVDMRAGPALQPLLPSHISQALASSTGLQGSNLCVCVCVCVLYDVRIARHIRMLPVYINTCIHRLLVYTCIIIYHV